MRLSALARVGAEMRVRARIKEIHFIFMGNDLFKKVCEADQIGLPGCPVKFLIGRLTAIL
jgi:hypothetical protein